MYLLDTDTIIYFLKNDPDVVNNFMLNADSPKALSVITIGYSVVTNNQRHFGKIPGLDTINWKKNVR
jgi:predicted nucleic acid-binding protein